MVVGANRSAEDSWSGRSGACYQFASPISIACAQCVGIETISIPRAMVVFPIYLATALLPLVTQWKRTYMVRVAVGVRLWVDVVLPLGEAGPAILESRLGSPSGVSDISTS